MSTHGEPTKPASACAMISVVIGILAQILYFTPIGFRLTGYGVVLLAIVLSVASFAFGIAAIGRREAHFLAGLVGIVLALPVPVYLVLVTA